MIGTCRATVVPSPRLGSHVPKTRCSMRRGTMLLLGGVLPTAIGPAAADLRSQTDSAAGSRSAPAVIEVPRRAAATIDGAFSPGEWDGAFKTSLQNGGELRLMSDGEYLFVGIRSRRLGYGSLCLSRPGEVRVLHSSAALGTAVYRNEGGQWKKSRWFSWCCRATEETPERQEHLRTEGWIASIGYMGPPQEMEYQIALEGGELTLAVVYQTGPSRETAYWWPVSLDDDCLGLTLSNAVAPETLRFSPETWMRVRVSAM
jgi:hypothetical protein